jgi:hypothetical protein
LPERSTEKPRSILNGEVFARVGAPQRAECRTPVVGRRDDDRSLIELEPHAAVVRVPGHNDLFAYARTPRPVNAKGPLFEHIPILVFTVKKRTR